jgi:hypothetical protein
MLKDKADSPLANAPSFHILIEKQDLCVTVLLGPAVFRLIWDFHPGDHPKQRGLAGSRGSQKGHKLTGLDLQTHVLEGRVGSKGFAQISNFDAHGFASDSFERRSIRISKNDLAMSVKMLSAAKIDDKAKAAGAL